MPQPLPGQQPETGLETATCRKFSGGEWADFEDTVTPEARLNLFWPGSEPVRLWAFPEGLERLVTGHALLELCSPGQVPALERREGFDFTLRAEPEAATPPPPESAPVSIGPERVLGAMSWFIESGGRWDATGCFHRAAVYDPSPGNFVMHAEDIGRHNCIDRLAGWSVETGQPLAGSVLFVSARATASLVAKAVRAGFSAMVSRSAVTTAGIETAAGAGMSLAGFARTARFTVFADANGLFRGAGLGPVRDDRERHREAAWTK